MSPDDRLAVLRHVLDAFNRHDVDAILEHFSDDAVFLASRGSDPEGQRFEGKASLAEAFAARFAAAPDMRFVDDVHFVAGDRGVSEWTTSGKNAAGEVVEARGCDLWTFGADGKIVRKDSFWKGT